MDPRFFVTREEFQDVHMDLKRVQSIQQHHAERLRMLEKRQADDAALKSVWNSPFPSALSGTPQHGPVHIPPNDVFDDFDEQNHSLLNSLHLGPAVEDEPIRRGAASRANSVRFDESALQGANWANQAGRHAEVGPVRPGSGLGGGGHHMMERSFSHKSDGRHSSTGLSVHSGVSGRVSSSLGLDTNFMVGGHEDDSPLDVPEPPPGFFFLGSAPAIIRCWLTNNFTSGSVLYAAVCSGSRRSTVEFSLVKELDLADDIHRDVDGVCRITLPVFLAEASVTQSNSRSPSPVPQLPSITTSFEVAGMDQPGLPDARKSVRIIIGSHTLRMHSADLLFSQNLMTLYGNDRDKLSVPFVRPEDEATFMYLTTTNLLPGKPKLNAAAPEFVSSEQARKPASQSPEGSSSQKVQEEQKTGESDFQGPLSPTSQTSQPSKTAAIDTPSESGAESERPLTDQSRTASESASRESHTAPSESARRESNAAIRTPWRLTASANGGEGGARDSAPLSGYQPASRPSRMKVLRPNKPSSSSARTGPSYEPAPTPRPSAEFRRKSQTSGPLSSADSSHTAGNGASTATVRWGDVSSKRSFSTSHAMGNFGGGGSGGGSSTSGTQPSASSSDAGKVPPAPRSANNPLGSASAFSWIGGSDPKAHAAAAE